MQPNPHPFLPPHGRMGPQQCLRRVSPAPCPLSRPPNFFSSPRERAFGGPTSKLSRAPTTHPSAEKPGIPIAHPPNPMNARPPPLWLFQSPGWERFQPLIRFASIPFFPLVVVENKCPRTPPRPPALPLQDPLGIPLKGFQKFGLPASRPRKTPKS